MRATLVDGPIAVSLTFGFDGQDLIATVSAEARGRTIGDTIGPTPWSRRFWSHVQQDGMRVPL